MKVEIILYRPRWLYYYMRWLEAADWEERGWIRFEQELHRRLG